MISSILQKQKERLQKFIEKGPNALKANAKLANDLQKIGLFGQHLSVLSDKLKVKGEELKDLYQEAGSDHEKFPFFEALVHYLFEAGLDWNSSLEVKELINEPQFKERKYSELVRAWKTSRDEDKDNWDAEWQAFYEFRFRVNKTKFFSNIWKSHGCTVNSALWSFTKPESLLPIYRQHINLSEELRREREKAFENLGKAQKFYSFVNEIVPNNVTQIFYFEKTEGGSADEESSINVYEIDAGLRGTKVRVFNKVSFNASHRKFIARLCGFKSSRDYLKGPDDYAVARNSEEFVKAHKLGHLSKPEKKQLINWIGLEKKYQYRVIQWLIRTGIFNPLQAAFRDMDNKTWVYEDLLRDAPLYIRRLVEIDPKKEYTPYNQYDTTERMRPDLVDYPSKYREFSDDEFLALIEHIDKNSSVHIDRRITTFDAGFFNITSDANSISHIYWLPVVTNWRDKESGGAIFVNSNRRLGNMKDGQTMESYLLSREDFERDRENYVIGDVYVYEYENHISIVPQEIISTLYFLTGLYDDKQIEEIQEEADRPSITAAAVSVMSRNISHNLGSHILSYLKNDLSSTAQMLEKDVLSNVIEKGKGRDAGKFMVNGNIFQGGFAAGGEIKPDQVFASYLFSLGSLLSYFQERQDYVGVIASGWYLYYGAVNLKNDIIDYFKNGKRISERWFPDSRNLILDYIAFSEGYSRRNIEINLRYLNGSGDFNSDRLAGLEVSLPAGIAGRQAIFTILENLIRNTAKHGNPIKERGKIVIDINIRESENYIDYYQLDIRENGGNINPSKLETIRKELKERLIRTDGTLVDRHKGIKEMQIAAAWLRGIKPYELIEKNHKPQILQVGEEKGNLIYTLYLRKVRPVLLVVEDRSKYKYVTESNQWKPEYENLSDWEMKSITELKRREQKLSYKFVIADASLTDEQLTNLKEQSPVRFMKLDLSDFLSKAHLVRKGFLEYRLYRKWINFKAPNEQYQFNLASIGSAKPSDASIGIFVSSIEKQNRLNEEADKVIIEDQDGRRAIEADIIYSRHFDTPLEYQRFNKNHVEALPDITFIEGVTQNNSTYRLVAQTEIDDLWCQRMRESALTKVLIIDERIWTNITQIGNEYGALDIEISKAFEVLSKVQDFTVPNTETDHALNLIRENLDQISRDQLDYYKLFDRYRNARKYSKIVRHYEPRKLTKEEKVKLAFKYDVHAKRGIDIFTLEAVPDRLIFHNLNNEEVAYLDQSGKIFLADGKNAIPEQYHFISIHQGTLEKMQRFILECQAGIKAKENNLEEAFSALRGKFHAQFRYLIHSGRSKTPNLPKGTAFLQLSSLDSALADCKYTLTDLLYSTILER